MFYGIPTAGTAAPVRNPSRYILPMMCVVSGVPRVNCPERIAASNCAKVGADRSLSGTARWCVAEAQSLAGDLSA